MDDPYLIMYKGDKEQAFLGVRDGWPALALEDPAGIDRALMTYDPDKDRSLLQLSDKDGKQAAEMALTSDYAIVDASDKAGMRRAVLKCSSDGVSQVYLTNESGFVVVRERSGEFHRSVGDGPHPLPFSLVTEFKASKSCKHR
ncbi:MAG TPA: hypothetical protein VFW40_03280 [Capsulimonadaceae bacterium]|nr:hypothetical protein [Capsulimonadaceae bacterium]